MKKKRKSKNREVHLKGMEHSTTKYNDYQVDIMKYLYCKCGWYQKQIGILFGIRQSSVQYVTSKR